MWSNYTSYLPIWILYNVENLKFLNNIETPLIPLTIIQSDFIYNFMKC